MSYDEVLANATPRPWPEPEHIPSGGERYNADRRFAWLAVNAHEALMNELLRLRDLVGEVDVTLIDEVLLRAKGGKP